MFQWDKSIDRVDVEANKVLHLFKSMRDVQMALPGVSAQEATAYLCQYVHGEGVATVAAFHLLKSNLLAFYHKPPLVAPLSKTDSMLDEGLNFVESMGFLLTDQDLHLLDTADQNMLWESLPLKSGIQAGEEEPPSPARKATEPVAAKKVAEVPDEVIDALKKVPVKAAPVAEKSVVSKQESAVGKPAEVEEDVADNVDDLLAAVEAMRAKRPGLRARKVMPSPEEMDRRKKELRENIGRILASQ